MGVYRYTARAKVRRVDGKDFGSFDYAYKPWSGYNAPRGFDAQCNRLEAMGARAAAKLNAREVSLVLPYGWPSDEYPLSEVRSVGHVPSGFYDTKAIGDPAGWMAKVNRRFKYFDSVDDAKAALGDSLRTADLY